MGPGPRRGIRAAAATAEAKATGMKPLGRHSNSRSSTAISTAARGVENIADMPSADPRFGAIERFRQEGYVTGRLKATAEPAATKADTGLLDNMPANASPKTLDESQSSQPSAAHTSQAGRRTWNSIKPRGDASAYPQWRSVINSSSDPTAGISEGPVSDTPSRFQR
jgi:hypothetical protein